jgi:NAD(P)-dependent dehydrogenase (short-subunit alcohol dehydrogenase family)
MSTRPDFNKDSTAGDVVNAFPEQVGGKTSMLPSPSPIAPLTSPVIITGPSSSSLGSATVTALAGSSQPPAQLIFAGRSFEKISPVIENVKSLNPSIKTTFVKLELDSLSSVRTAAKEVLSSVEKIDILINNAGVMFTPTYTTTEAGVEMQFGVNHLGHWLLTVLLLRSPIGKGMSVVNVSSLAYEMAEFGDPNWDVSCVPRPECRRLTCSQNGKKYSGWEAYGLSKTSNILFSLALKERGVRSLAVHPGGKHPCFD